LVFFFSFFVLGKNLESGANRFWFFSEREGDKSKDSSDQEERLRLRTVPHSSNGECDKTRTSLNKPIKLGSLRSKTEAQVLSSLKQRVNVFSLPVCRCQRIGPGPPPPPPLVQKGTAPRRKPACSLTQNKRLIT
jgi:hypothetical protein